MRVVVPLAYVRLATGGTVSLEEGETVPAEADTAHVQDLLGKGVLVLEDGEEAPMLVADEDAAGTPGSQSVAAGEPSEPGPAAPVEPVNDQTGGTAASAAKKVPGRPGPRGGSPA